MDKNPRVHPDPVAGYVTQHDITAVILAGGRGSRMGGVDKGLQLLHGQSLIARALARITPQVGAVIINANRNLEQYQSFDAPVCDDGNDDFSGPLSGFVVGLKNATTPYVLILPCDTPNFPNDLAQRMMIGLKTHNAEIAMAATGGFTQPVFCLLKIKLLDSLLAFMQSGKRKIDAWTALHKTVLVEFENESAFANANTLEQLRELEKQ